jgi:RNA polymerase sigma factor (sigma-70 family)
MQVEREDGAHADTDAQLIAIAVQMNRQLKSFLRRFERDAQLIDDLVQDVYVEVLKSIRSFSRQSSLESWVYGVAMNVGRQHVARQVVQRQRFTECDEVVFEEVSVPDVLHLVSMQQRLTRVQDKLREMPESLSSTFEAYIEDGLTYEETAQSLSIPVGTVRSRIFRVRELVRDC